MEKQILLALPQSREPGVTPRSLLTSLFRKKRVILITFAVVCVGVLIAVLLVPLTYESEMRVVVERERFDSIITANSIRDAGSSELEKLDTNAINTEVDLLQSPDLLRDVVLACRLQNRLGFLTLMLLPSQAEPYRIEAAVNALQKHLDVEPPARSNLVTITYADKEPKVAADVTEALLRLYLQKHLASHRPQGQYRFFQQEVERYKKELSDVEAERLKFQELKGVTSPELEKQQTLTKLADFKNDYQLTAQSIAEIERRIADLEEQAQKIPPRRTTQVRTSAVLLEGLKTTLFNLQLRRTELLQKYEPSYRAVQDLDKQIAETKEAIRQSEVQPTSEQTTDGDPTFDWITSELAKSRSALAGFRARAASITRSIDKYQRDAEWLAATDIEEAQVMRRLKSAEENYTAAVRKLEAARMSDALDSERIVNVAVAEHPTKPSLPKYTRSMELILGLCLAGMLSTVVGFAADYWDATFRTPDEIAGWLQVPVLAAFSRSPELAAIPQHTNRGESGAQQ